jgi:hypothetical protein
VERLNPERSPSTLVTSAWPHAGLFQRRHDHLLDLIQRDRRRSPGPVLINKLIEALFTNRVRHFVTVVGCIRSSAAICLLGTPSAQANTIMLRCANACADIARHTHRCSWSRSCSVNTTTGGGRPVRATHIVQT